MKKLLLLILLLFFTLTGCEFSPSKNIVKEFLNASNLEADIKNTLEDEYTSLTETLCNLKLDKDAMSMKFYSNNVYLGYDSVKNMLYYDDGSNKYYSNLNALIDPDYTVFPSKNKETNIDPYLIDEIYLKSRFSFKIDIEKMLIGENEDFESDIMKLGLDPIDCSGTIENGKVTSFTVDCTEMVSILSDLGISGISKWIITLENVKYNENMHPLQGVDVSKYTYENYDFILQTFAEKMGLIEEEPEPAPEPITYRLEGFKTDFTILPGEEIKLEGYLYDNLSNVISLYSCNVSMYPELDVNKIGYSEYDVLISYKDATITTRIKVNVVESKGPGEIVKVLDTGILQTFEMGDYLLVADNTTLYKFNYETNSIEASVDLKCQANGTYVKDGYLYVSANYPVIDSNNCSGTISKINLSDFSLEKQITVNFYPYSIFVDKRNDVIVGKGKNQHIYYLKVDLETATTTELSAKGYEKDFLIYHESKDAFLAVTLSHTGPNEWFKYDGTKYAIDNSSHIYYIDRIWFISDNGKVLIDYSSNETIVGVFNEYINDYNFKKINLNRADAFTTRATYKDGKVYIVTTNETDLNVIVTIYDLNTSESTHYRISVLSRNIKHLHYNNGKLYINYTDSGYLEVFQLDN